LASITAATFLKEQGKGSVDYTENRIINGNKQLNCYNKSIFLDKSFSITIMGCPNNVFMVIGRVASTTVLFLLENTLRCLHTCDGYREKRKRMIDISTYMHM